MPCPRTLAAALALSALGASPSTQAGPPPSSPTADASTVPPAPPLPPLSGDWLESFAPLGFVSPPTGSTTPRPVVIAVHGRMDRADWACAEWRAVFGPRPFIVCPQGSPASPGYAWPDGAPQLRAAIDRLLDAAQARYGAHLDRDHRVFAGFSQGAIVSAKLLCDERATYPLAALQEGFPDDLATQCARTRGVRRVLLGCSQPGCARRRARLRAALVRAGVDARINDAGDQGHTMNGVVLESLRRDLPWLVDPDPFWRHAIVE